MLVRTRFRKITYNIAPNQTHYLFIKTADHNKNLQDTKQKNEKLKKFAYFIPVDPKPPSPLAVSSRFCKKRFKFSKVLKIKPQTS